MKQEIFKPYTLQLLPIVFNTPNKISKIQWVVMVDEAMEQVHFSHEIHVVLADLALVLLELVLIGIQDGLINGAFRVNHLFYLQNHRRTLVTVLVLLVVKRDTVCAHELQRSYVVLHRKLQNLRQAKLKTLNKRIPASRINIIDGIDNVRIVVNVIGTFFSAQE